ncbi:MAG TPA: efflux RND transporter periplasmic adaptor subunit [Gammaproteobacteria bacterium]
MKPQSGRAFAALAAAALVAACGPGTEGGNPNAGNGEQQIPAVEAVEVVRGTLPLEERLAGSVRARNQTEIYAQVTGQIVEVLANDGDWVEAGTPLVRLRNTDYEERLNQAEAGLRVAEARVRQAEANLTRLEATLRRIEAMAERNLTSAAELETAQADAASAEADLALMQAQLAQAESLVKERRAELAETIVRAPISGVVGSRNAEVGQLANTSTPLFVIGDTSDMLVDVTLTQRMLAYIDTGTTVNISTEAAPERVLEATITRISPFLHPVTRTTQAEIEVEEHDGLLRPGMFVTVAVLYGETEVAPLIPNSAIYRNPEDGREGVFAASLEGALRNPELPDAASLPADGPGLEPVGPVAVRFVPIDIIARGRLTSAVRGVEPGEWVVTLGHRLLSNSDSGQALIQPTPWDHIMRLQQMQTRDLLDVIRDRQSALLDTNSLESLN